MILMFMHKQTRKQLSMVMRLRTCTVNQGDCRLTGNREDYSIICGQEMARETTYAQIQSYIQSKLRDLFVLNLTSNSIETIAEY